MNFPRLTLFDIVPPKFFLRLALSATLIFVLLTTPLLGALTIYSGMTFTQTVSAVITPCSALIGAKRDLPPFLRANDTVVAGGWCAANPHLLILRDSP